MVLTKEELLDLIEPKGDIEKLSTISFDGKTFSTRIPKDIIEELGIKKGDKLRWLVKENSSKLELKLEKENGSN